MVKRAMGERPSVAERGGSGMNRCRKLSHNDDQLAALVFVERYGLDGSPPRSLAEVAEAHGLTRLRVRLLESRVLAILKAVFRNADTACHPTRSSRGVLRTELPRGVSRGKLVRDAM